MNNKIKKVGFLLSHPIQYFSPLMQEMERHLKPNFKVFYCSDHGITEKYDTGFGRTVKWDIPLLDNYPYEFVENNSFNPSVSNFFGLINYDLIKVLYQNELDVLIIHGWGFFSNIFAILIGKVTGVKVWLRAETPLNQERFHSSKSLFLRRIVLHYFLFKLIDKFLYIGQENRDFFKYYGVKEHQLIFTPYSVDNKTFNESHIRLLNQKEKLKAQKELPSDHINILFCGKFIEKKRPLDLIMAFKLISGKHQKVSLIMIGDGELKEAIKIFIKENSIENVYLPGFINQTEINAYYALADIFVLPSQSGETWGLVVNEAMNFGLPIVASHLVGCAKDLVRNDQNGFIYEMGNVDQLALNLEHLLVDEDLRKRFGNKSKEIINQFSNDVIVQNMLREL